MVATQCLSDYVDCPAESISCQDGFNKVNETALSFVCQAPLDSEYRGSYYTVSNSTHTNLHISSRYDYAHFKNEVEITSLKLRYCVTKAHYFDGYINNGGDMNHFYLDGYGEYRDLVEPAGNGSVQSTFGELDVAWIGSQTQPVLFLAIMGFVKK